MTIERLRWSKMEIENPIPKCRDACEASAVRSVDCVNELGWC